ncbi:MAG: ribosome maturation factor RimM [Omnitrophica WOR_2 bacterium]
MTPRRIALEKPNAAGSPPSGEPAFLAVGKLRRPHGVHGEMLMEVLTDFPERLKKGATLYIGDEHQPLKLASLRWHNQGMLVTFRGVDTPENAGELRNLIAYVQSKDRPPLDEGEYYHHQLLGLKVYDEEGAILGEVTQILETGANDVLVVQPESGAEILLPALDSVILEVNLEEAKMRVHVLPGLILGKS